MPPSGPAPKPKPPATDAMSYRDNAVELAELTAWAQQAAEALSLQPLAQDDVEMVLSASAQASAGLVRSAGPVAMYLAGLLVATGQAPDVATACQTVGRLMHIPELATGTSEVEHTPKSIQD